LHKRRLRNDDAGNVPESLAVCTNLLHNKKQWQWVSATGGDLLLGYARVSTGEEQDTRLQETALRAAGVERLFTERASGGRWDRPELHSISCGHGTSWSCGNWIGCPARARISCI
jgi:hypothetical protein